MSLIGPGKTLAMDKLKGMVETKGAANVLRDLIKDIPPSELHERVNGDGHGEEFDALQKELWEKLTPPEQIEIRNLLSEKLGQYHTDPTQRVPHTFGGELAPEVVDAIQQASNANGDAELFKQSPALALSKLLMNAPVKPTGGQKPKRKPLLVDEYLVGKPNLLMNKKQEQVIKDRLREAKVFVFDQEATEFAGHMIHDHSLHIAYQQEFAIPPFQRMYIEYPVEPFFRALGQESLFDHFFGDTTVGYFIDGPRVYVLSRGKASVGEEKPHITPFCYRLNQPFTNQEEIDMATRLGTSRIGLDQFYWGSALEWIKDDQHAVRSLRAFHSFMWLYGDDKLDKIRGETMEKLLVSGAGDLRNIIAMIMLLNRASNVTYTDTIGTHRALIHNKPSTFLKHSIVHFKLNPRKALRKLFGTGGVWRREHDVRGCFCHDKTARNSGHHPDGLFTPDGHDWREYDVNQWRCAICGGKKWHRKEHKRGHKEKGIVKTEYEVTE